ncbi:hypothetical protein LTR62_007444 [Meristemomyces frigidus]|uniref:CPAF-like PDZ domain-containing protein n=1 Tax=Meristemomyces frigidus TaxID=1508187 RepID=A0AAN7TMH0_9PEZI|nr:hypothetical protein LTR62_007444 [Meristemomyces frigidus]
MAKYLVSSLALAVGAFASPQWQWEKHSHPGWPEPSVYTPHGPPRPTWPWSMPAKPYPTPTVTASSTNSTITSASVTSSVTSSASAVGACASVSVLAASSISASPSAVPTVPAELAYECINSVPFNQSAAIALLDSIRPYLDWQTTIEYLKDPPAEYAAKVQPPYDFYANWDRIVNNAATGNYANEYAFGFDLYRLFQRTHDGHFVFYPDSVTEIFSFGRTTPLVSVSSDGTSIPEVYVYADVLAASFGNISFTPSPLTQIDGQDSTEWLLAYSENGSLQDPDALWNNMFYLLAQVSLGASGTGTGTFSGGGRGRWIYPGPTTTLTFANGTSVTSQNFARVLSDFSNITSGEDIYSQYFIPPATSIGSAEELATMTTSSASSVLPSSTSSAPTSSTTTIPAPGFPSPIIREMDNTNSGYFLDGAGYDDVAVLSVPTFVGATADEIPFQAVNTYLINRAVAANKTKLIIDVSANGGGTILQGYDLFKQLFPQILPYGATRFRAHEAFNLIGEEISYYSGLVPRSLDTNDTVQNWVSSSWNYRTDADVNYEPFTSWAEKYGPHAFGPEPDNFTSIIRWNLSDPLTPDNSGGIYVSGYLNRSNITTQPFAAENIILVYDGYCASTCTIFSELMRQQGGVRTVALGGRPNKEIIQAVGGVKGTNDYPYDYILSAAEFPFTYQYLHNDSYYNSTALGAYNDLALFRSTDSVVNARDGIRQGDASETPLQFLYETADCRIFYTPEMAVDQTAVWKTVADSVWNGVDHCVAGGFANSSSSSAGGYGNGKRAVVGQKRRRHSVSRELGGGEQHLEAIERLALTRAGGPRGAGDGMMVL